MLTSVLEYSTAWIDSTTNMSEVPLGAGILPNDNDIEPEDSISHLSAARSRSADIMTRPVNQDLASVNLLH